MPGIPNPEGKAIGALLRVHRELLGVSDDDMIRHGGLGAWWDLKWTQNAAAPSELRVRHYYTVVREAIEHAAAPLTVPTCQAEQWYSTDRDTALCEKVWATGRRVAWWWGIRRTSRGAGAECYVCNTLIHAYDITRGMTHPARVSVMHHRADHVSELIQAAKRPGENKVTK